MATFKNGSRVAQVQPCFHSPGCPCSKVRVWTICQQTHMRWHRIFVLSHEIWCLALDSTGFNSNLPGMYKVSFMSPIRKLLLSSRHRHVHLRESHMWHPEGPLLWRIIATAFQSAFGHEKSAKSRNFRVCLEILNSFGHLAKKEWLLTIGYSFFRICTKFNI